MSANQTISVVMISPGAESRGKTPGAGRRVQCGAEPDEASNTLTRRPATHNHASDSRARPHATADCLRMVRARCRCLFTDCPSPCQIADVACSWTRPIARTAHGQSTDVAAVPDWTRINHRLLQLQTVHEHSQSMFASCAWRVHGRGLPVPLSATAENGAALGAASARTPSPNEN